MRIYIVIPAHNEANYIEKTLLSLADQSMQPKRVVVVDDQSNDDTARLVKNLSRKYPFIQLVKKTSSNLHLPGSKVVNAFNAGLNVLDENYEILCKFDADLIFPENYLEEIARHFRSHPKIGMVGGFCHIEKEEKWILEDLTNKDHIRGALKAYRKDCFKAIGGLKPSMGWDTVDELLAQYHGWSIKTDPSLVVKHLRSTGFTYNKQAKLKQGQAFYKLRYGFLISLIASAKLAAKKRNPRLFKDYLQGYLDAKRKKLPFLVSKKEGAFIRRLRYKKMWSKVF